MIAFLATLPAGGTALMVASASGGFWLAMRVQHRWERRRAIMARHAGRGSRCGARN